MVAVDWQIIWTDIAKEQLRDAYKNLLEQSNSKATTNRVFEDIFKKAKALLRNPYVFQPDRLRTTKDESIRAFEKHKYRITYQISPDLKAIAIIRFRHTSMEPFIE